MRVQAGVVQNLSTTRAQIAGLVSSSQGASGALQAAQSGNQLVALQTTQLADLTAVMAAIARAQSLEGARNVANQAQAQQQLTNFLSYGPGYQPGAAQMFHDARGSAQLSRLGSRAWPRRGDDRDDHGERSLSRQ